MKFKMITESKETDKLYKAISDTADAIDDLDEKNEKSAKKNLDSADDKISDVKDNLKESLSDDVGVASLFNDLIQREYELLSEYESAQVTLEDHSVATFDDIFDYIKDDINIHIGMLEAALEDINPSSEKTEEGKEQGETLLLDESLFK